MIFFHDLLRFYRTCNRTIRHHVHEKPLVVLKSTKSMGRHPWDIRRVDTSSFNRHEDVKASMNGIVKYVKHILAATSCYT